MECLIALALGLFGLCICGSAEKIPLHFSFITTKTGSFVASGAIPMVDLALEQINSRTDILQNYTLNYTTILDSACNATVSLDRFMEHFRGDSQPTYLSVFCCGCSTATISVAEVSHYWNIPQMAPVAGTYELNDRTRFRGFFHTDTSHEFVGAALAEIARQFHWTQMAIITQKESIFLRVAESLEDIFKSEQRVLGTSTTIDKSADSFNYNQILNWERDYRIMILNAGSDHAYIVLCEAYYRGWRPPKYVWITYGWYFKGWWKSYGNSSCTMDIMMTMVNGSLVVTPNGDLVSDDRYTPTFSGLTPQQYEDQYVERLQLEHYQVQNFTESPLSGTAYDGAWAMALGLDIASERVNRNDSSGCGHLPGELVPLENFTYKNEMMGCVLRNSFHQVNFSGITGEIIFDGNGSRPANTICVQQYHVSGEGIAKRNLVAEVVINTNTSEVIFKKNLTAESLWRDGIPYDGAAVEVLHTNHKALIAIYSFASFAGLVYTTLCLLFIVIFRKRKVVKLSSPNLNYLIIAGAALLYVSVFLYVFSAQNKHQAVQQTLLCNFRQWLFSIGYTLCFAVILAKTWRVYYIFSIPTAKKKIPKDWFLLVVVLVVVGVDLLIITIGTAIPSSRLNATLAADIQHPKSVDADGITYTNFVFVCVNKGAIVWLAISYAYKGLLQLVAMLMAFHTRGVRIKALNDSMEIAAIIYINSITLALLTVVEFSLSNYHEVHASMFGLALLVGATLFLSLVFVPRLIHLYKDPKGESVLDPTSTLSYIHTTVGRTDSDEIAALKQQLSEMEKKLADVQVEI